MCVRVFAGIDTIFFNVSTIFPRKLLSNGLKHEEKEEKISRSVSFGRIVDHMFLLELPLNQLVSY